nr:MAG TPA: hypothetical protein [Caudoviricetes sp.]
MDDIYNLLFINYNTCEISVKQILSLLALLYLKNL